MAAAAFWQIARLDWQGQLAGRGQGFLAAAAQVTELAGIGEAAALAAVGLAGQSRAAAMLAGAFWFGIGGGAHQLAAGNNVGGAGRRRVWRRRVCGFGVAGAISGFVSGQGAAAAAAGVGSLALRWRRLRAAAGLWRRPLPVGGGAAASKACQLEIYAVTLPCQIAAAALAWRQRYSRARGGAAGHSV